MFCQSSTFFLINLEGKEVLTSALLPPETLPPPFSKFVYTFQAPLP